VRAPQVDSPRPEIVINGVMVGFHSRDVRLVSGKELLELEALVDEERRYEAGRAVESLLVLTDYLGRGMRYQTTVRVRTDGEEQP
jgi:hypothetical protein